MKKEALKPRTEFGKAKVLAGLNMPYTYEGLKNIPDQWQKFAKYMGQVPGQKSAVSYGVSWNFRPNTGMDYLAAVEVVDGKNVPKELTVISVPSREYAVFSLEGHVSEIHDLFGRIHEEWRPQTELHPDESGMIFEKYTERFDPKTGQGGIELWIPLK